MSARLFGPAGIVAGAAAMMLGATPAAAQRTRIQPYIEASQVLTADLSNGGDVLTYSTIGAGIDASVQTRRVQVQLDYRYERRIPWDRKLTRDDVHSGLATVRAKVAPSLTIEAGAIASQVRSDIRGPAPNAAQARGRNLNQLFSGYVGPNVATQVGPAFLNAAYRFGYTKADASLDNGLAPALPRLDQYDDSRVHVATVSTGVKAGTVLPVGVTLSGSVTREDAGQLDQRFTGKYGRGDVLLPVARSVALTAGIGYERITVSQRDPLRTAGGVPVIDGRGRFVTDPASPRRIAYDFDGMYWDGGVIWQPSRRTRLEARVGRRYGSVSYTGNFSHQIGTASGVQINVFDSVTTFGQQLGGALVALPDSFVTSRDAFGNQYSGCIYGTSGAAAGGCLNGLFASSVTSAYRTRGVTGVAVMAHGATRFGIGAGYARRTFLAPDGTPGLTINGAADETLFAQLFASTPAGPEASVTATVYGNYYDSDLAGAQGILGWGANAAYVRRIGRIDATASVGVYGYENENQSSAAIQALLGLRYGF